MNPHDYLISLGVKDIPHSGRTFYEHLCNTEQILRISRQPEHVCNAGLFHSIYGTNFFPQQTTNNRNEIKSVIGEEAENLVYLFCNAHRPYCWFTGNDLVLRNSTYVRLDNKTLHELRMIESANLIDQQLGAEIITSFYSQENKRYEN